jgi:hypothetical protein
MTVTPGYTKNRTVPGLGFGVYGAALGDVVKIDVGLEFIEPA